MHEQGGWLRAGRAGGGIWVAVGLGVVTPLRTPRGTVLTFGPCHVYTHTEIRGGEGLESKETNVCNLLGTNGTATLKAVKS